LEIEDSEHREDQPQKCSESTESIFQLDDSLSNLDVVEIEHLMRHDFLGGRIKPVQNRRSGHTNFLSESEVPGSSNLFSKSVVIDIFLTGLLVHGG
jgi:hypothetical protein